ncbi:adenylate kinase [Propioniciclava sinopodophylli]|uniref:Adenylate kinase n=1 Tax=Propioniciclava sinopodophylli TaxID=1837344 RepID=A0A4Q9KFK6_9ACTN|nr:adenylate kinase [Propioniciclava sinopodophylli]TBT86641.1 adenylate kinase [Propioniciclava sinopodophylli]
MRLLIMGPPGAGKGTQASSIADHYGIVTISTGQLFRDNIQLGTPLGKQIEALIAAGNLVPDEVTNQMVFQRLASPDVKKRGGFLLDGYPRTLEQVEALDGELVRSRRKLQAVIALVADPSQLVERLLKRAEIEGRADDNADSIRHRIDVYHAETAPLLEVYRDRGLLVEVDAMGAVEDVRTRITDALDAKLGHPS